jgi:hypothetical protein
MSQSLYDVLICSTCLKEHIEPDIKECESCERDVCPDCRSKHSDRYHKNCWAISHSGEQVE